MPSLRDPATGRLYIVTDPGSQQYPKPLTQDRADERVATGLYENYVPPAGTVVAGVPDAAAQTRSRNLRAGDPLAGPSDAGATAVSAEEMATD